MRRTRDLDWENFIVLSLVDALHQNVSPSLVAVSFSATRQRIFVHFKLRTHGPTDDEDVRDILGELEAKLGSSHIIVDWTIDVGGFNSPWQGEGKRLVFLAKQTDEEWREYAATRDIQLD